MAQIQRRASSRCLSIDECQAYGKFVLNLILSQAGLCGPFLLRLLDQGNLCVPCIWLKTRSQVRRCRDSARHTRAELTAGGMVEVAKIGIDSGAGRLGLEAFGRLCHQIVGYA